MTIITQLVLTIVFVIVGAPWGLAQERDSIDERDVTSGAIFDDRVLLEGYTEKYMDETKEVLLAMIADDTLGTYKCAAAVRVFKDQHAGEILTKEKAGILRVLIRRFNQRDSPFVEVEIMHTLVVLDRYQYFESMVPALIQKMEHYNPVVSEIAYNNIQAIIKGSTRNREARIVFNTLRKILFLSRNRLQKIATPDQKLKNKISLLRWSITVLGTQELKRLPAEVINLL